MLFILWQSLAERLATVSDVSTFLHDPWGRLSGSPCKSLAPSSSHYEVLLALLLRHQDFREAARVATALFIRLRGDGLGEQILRPVFPSLVSPAAHLNNV